MIKYLDNINKIDENIYFHLYGKKTRNPSILDNFINYKCEIKNKDCGLFRYHYHFMGENSEEQNYFTEKLIDPILSETLCFYWGCPNISSWIDERAYIKIDITRPFQSLQIIINAMKNDEREKRLKYIRAAKKKFLTEMSVIPMINKIINNNLK